MPSNRSAVERAMDFTAIRRIASERAMEAAAHDVFMRALLFQCNEMGWLDLDGMVALTEAVEQAERQREAAWCEVVALEAVRCAPRGRNE